MSPETKTVAIVVCIELLLAIVFFMFWQSAREAEKERIRKCEAKCEAASSQALFPRRGSLEQCKEGCDVRE